MWSLWLWLLVAAAPALAAEPVSWGWGAEGDMPAKVRSVVLECAAQAVRDGGRAEVVVLGAVKNLPEFRSALEKSKLAGGFWFGYQRKGQKETLFVWRVETGAADSPYRASPLGEYYDRPCNLAGRLVWELLDKPLEPYSIKLLEQAYGAWTKGDPLAADDFFRKAAYVSDKSAGLCRDAGRMWAENGRPDQALLWYQLALTRQPRDFLTYLWLARMYEQNDQPAEARQALLNALDTGPRLPVLLVSVGRHEVLNGRVTEGQQLLEEAARRDPDDPTTELELLRAAERNQDWGVASAALARVLALQGGSFELHQMLVDYQLRAGNYPAAEQTLNQLRKQAPNDPDLFHDYLRLLVATGRHAEAEPLLTDYLKRQPNAFWALYELGRIHYQARRFTEAAAVLERAAALAPADVQIQQLLNKTYELAGDKERSFAYYERRLTTRQESGNEELDRYLTLAQELGRQDRAAATLEQLLRGASRPAQRVAVAIALGRMQEKQGRPDEAIRTYRSLPGRFQRDPRLLFELGRLYFQMQDNEAGAAEFRELLVYSGDARLLMSAAKLCAGAGQHELSVDLLGAAYRADGQATTAGVLYLEQLLLREQDRGNLTLINELHQKVAQDDERELLYWLELFWYAETGRNDYFNELLPYALRLVARRPATKVELAEWASVVQDRLYGMRRGEMLDLLAVFARKIKAETFAAKYAVSLVEKTVKGD